jgi:hypothetical protein
MNDAIDLSTVTIHNSPSDIASWPVTRTITGVRLQNDSAPDDQRGLGFLFDNVLPENWKASPGPDSPPGDNWQYTVWVALRVNGGWHASGFIDMWQGRPATGAPIEEHWNDWAYDVSRWGDMVNFPPKPGDAIGLFVSAGNARGQSGVTSVRERSNVVAILLPAGDAGTWSFPVAPPSPPLPVPTPTPAPTPSPAPVPSPSDAALFARLDADLIALGALIESVQLDVRALVAKLDAIVTNGVQVHL